MPYWGYHALYDCSDCDYEAINSPDTIKDFIQQMILEIDMVSIGDTIIRYCPTHDPKKSGYSFYQMIETSNLSGHFVESSNEGYIDVFSCKPFDITIAESVIQSYFKPSKIRLNYITRCAR